LEGNILNSNNEVFLYEYVKKELEKDTSFEIHPAVPLIELADTKMNTFSKEEIDFIKRGSRVDVIVTKGHGRRKVVFVFESDSSFHDSILQRKRDKLKDRILQKSGIYVMRFRQNPHYQPNEKGERFIDAVFSSLRKQEFVKALGRLAWEAANKGDSTVFLDLPYQKEFEMFIKKAEDVGENLKLSEEWCQEKHGTIWNKQTLTIWKNRYGKDVTSATGRCSEKEFLYGTYAAAERFALMGCLNKYLINKKILKFKRRPFLNFLDDRQNYNHTYDYYRKYEIIEEDD
jgi:hypothetical protein